jgi:hypothetical protein
MANGAVVDIVLFRIARCGERGIPDQHRANQDNGYQSATFHGPGTRVRYKPIFLLVHVKNMLSSQAGYLQRTTKLSLTPTDHAR